jgi:hypothetical protein
MHHSPHELTNETTTPEFVVISNLLVIGVNIFLTAAFTTFNDVGYCGPPPAGID